jgi:hypothetical protein
MNNGGSIMKKSYLISLVGALLLSASGHASADTATIYGLVDGTAQGLETNLQLPVKPELRSMELMDASSGTVTRDSAAQSLRVTGSEIAEGRPVYLKANYGVSCGNSLKQIEADITVQSSGRVTYNVKDVDGLDDCGEAGSTQQVMPGGIGRAMFAQYHSTVHRVASGSVYGVRIEPAAGR